MFRTVISRKLFAQLLFLLSASFMIIKCNYFTEPEPFQNKEASQSLGGITLKDHYTGEICQNNKSIFNNTLLQIVPDSSINYVKITDIQIDTTTLIQKIGYSYEIEWRPSNEYSGCHIYTTKDNIIRFLKVGGWKGIHTVKFYCKITNPKSGLEVLTPTKNIIEIILDFK